MLQLNTSTSVFMISWSIQQLYEAVLSLNRQNSAYQNRNTLGFLSKPPDVARQLVSSFERLQHAQISGGFSIACDNVIEAQ